MTLIAADGFASFSGQHFLILGLFLLGIPLVVRLGRRQRGTDAEETTRRVMAVGVVVAAVPIQIYQLLPADWDLGTSLPLALCDLAWLAVVYALWTRSWWAAGLAYYWGLTLTIQGLLTPSLGQTFPDVRYFGFWSLHLLVVWSAVYLTWGIGVRPTWSSYRLAVAATAVWAAVVYLFNVVADTNYGYLNHKPSATSILDLLGPWPWYVLAEIAIVVTVWAAMTYPWVRRVRTSAGAAAGRAAAGSD
jgi:hypothetical integral membrane protein (TIGR02206 family)